MQLGSPKISHPILTIRDCPSRSIFSSTMILSICGY